MSPSTWQLRWSDRWWIAPPSHGYTRTRGAPRRSRGRVYSTRIGERPPVGDRRERRVLDGREIATTKSGDVHARAVLESVRNETSGSRRLYGRAFRSCVRRGSTGARDHHPASLRLARRGRRRPCARSCLRLGRRWWLLDRRPRLRREHRHDDHGSAGRERHGARPGDRDALRRAKKRQRDQQDQHGDADGNESLHHDGILGARLGRAGRRSRLVLVQLHELGGRRLCRPDRNRPSDRTGKREQL